MRLAATRGKSMGLCRSTLYFSNIYMIVQTTTKLQKKQLNNDKKSEMSCKTRSMVTQQGAISSGTSSMGKTVHASNTIQYRIDRQSTTANNKHNITNIELPDLVKIQNKTPTNVHKTHANNNRMMHIHPVRIDDHITDNDDSKCGEYCKCDDCAKFDNNMSKKYPTDKHNRAQK